MGAKADNMEIERKFLVDDLSCVELATERHKICQGYLSKSDNCTIRVRLMDDTAFLTIKGGKEAGKIGHFEWEKEIDKSDGEALMKMCVGGFIEKERYIIPNGQTKIELDVFHGLHEGLVMAEIELPTEDYEPQLPSFLGEEVTGDKRYTNSYLSQHPYSQN